MRFKLLLSTNPASVLMINYQYPLSAAIYKIIQRADETYSTFLHDKGYSQGGLKNFKLFTFSDIKTPFRIKGDRLHLLSGEAELMIAFHLPKAAEAFIQGLFLNQQLEVADYKSKVVFQVKQVEVLPDHLPDDADPEVILVPLSPVVCGRKNAQGHYDFLPPEHESFVPQLLYNWKEKYQTVYGPADADGVFEKINIEVRFYKNPPKSRLITIKAGTSAETKIRGFMNFQLKVKAPREALELLLDSGTGLYNAMGMGCVGINLQ